MTQKIAGNWQFERILGSGGFGQVELWREKFCSKRIAIKRCMLPKTEMSQKQMDRWALEIENMNNFNHPNIVKSEPVPEKMVCDRPVLCMEFCNKGDLRKLLKKPENTCGLLQSEVLSVMRDISSALMYLHNKNITHRDLKPENVVLHEKNETIIYKLIDLGYAKELGSKTTTASLVGTFNYVAPELFWKKKYTCSVDYWSLGILFFEVLTGYKPFIPYFEKLSNWIKNMQYKTYEQICAEEVDGGIKFHDKIIYPHDLSDNISNQLIEWFRIVLQWDPRKRGKRSSTEEVVVFPILKEIFSWQTIQIFSFSSYQIDHYDFKHYTTIEKLQQWIQEKFSIPINKQTIVDMKGNVLNKLKGFTRLSLVDVPNSILYVYEEYRLEISSDDCDSKLLNILDLMLLKPQSINDRSLLKQCYTALIYLMRREVFMFEQYVFALGTKFDITIERFNALNKAIEECLPNSEDLLNKVKKTESNSDLKSIEVSETFKDLCLKIKTLYNSIQCIKTENNKTQGLIQEIKKFFENGRISRDLQELNELYEDFLDKFQRFENETTNNSDYINDNVNILSELFGNFEDQKGTKIQAPETIAIARKLVCFEKKVNDRFDAIDSARQLIPFYNTRFSELLNQIYYQKNVTTCTLAIAANNSPMLDQSPSPPVPTEVDTEIKDNIVLRAMFNQYFQGIKENFENINLD